MLFIEKFYAKQLVDNHLNILIKAANTVIVEIIRIETLKFWQRLKIHKMLLTKYLRKRKIELFCQEIELFIELYFKTKSHWLIGKSQTE